MVQYVHYGGAICAFNVYIQVECVCVDEVTPSLTNMRELAPPKSDIPIILHIQSIAVEYSEECVVVEPIDSHVCVWVVRRQRW